MKELFQKKGIQHASFVENRDIFTETANCLSKKEQKDSQDLDLERKR